MSVVVDPNEVDRIVSTLPVRLRMTLDASRNARAEYHEPTDTDVARDLNRSARTIRRHRAAMRKRGLPIPALKRPGRPKAA